MQGTKAIEGCLYIIRLDYTGNVHTVHTLIAYTYVCMYVPYQQLTCWLRVAIGETEEGGEISHALND